jgi:hypothetical protein
MAKKCRATVKDVFWILGEYDIVAVVEAPDDISITALASVYAGRHEDDPWQGGQELNLLRAAALVASMNAPKSTLALIATPIR